MTGQEATATAVLAAIIIPGIAGALQHAWISTEVWENKWNLRGWKPFHSSTDLPSPIPPQDHSQ